MQAHVKNLTCVYVIVAPVFGLFTWSLPTVKHGPAGTLQLGALEFHMSNRDSLESHVNKFGGAFLDGTISFNKMKLSPVFSEILLPLITDLLTSELFNCL